MQKILIAIVLLIFIVGCRNNKDECIDSMMKEKGYSYKDAKDACEDAQIDTYAR